MEFTHIATSANPTLLGLDAARVWDTELAFAHLHAIGKADTKRTAERRLNSLAMLPKDLTEADLADESDRPPNHLVVNWAIDQARKRRARVLFAQLSRLPGGRPCLHANDARGARFWVPLTSAGEGESRQALHALQRHIGKAISVFPHGSLVAQVRAMTGTPNIQLCLQGYPPVLPDYVATNDIRQTEARISPNLKHLESESIHIIREAVAEAQRPVMLYSGGKASSVMLHLAHKAFHPATPPFPLLHIDTLWHFQELYLFRDQMAREYGMKLLVHSNPDAVARNINPFDCDIATFTDVTKTQGLKQALDRYKFDVTLSGTRRDGNPANAAQRVFSFRTSTHHWSPKNRYPDPWNLFNTRKAPGERIRALPLSNWTEIDIWQYIFQKNIPITPLYFARPRPVLQRHGMTMMVDDKRCRIMAGEEIQIRNVRFESLDSYPLTSAVESANETVEEILLETINKVKRQSGTKSAPSINEKPQESYF